MRTLKELGYPQDTDVSKFPDGQIRNETDLSQGTPVTREVYGDILTNFYKLLRSTGVSPTQTEDSELTQYQIIQALKLLANDLNDIKHILTVGGTSISIGINFDLLPNNYVLICQISDTLSSLTTYTLEGTGLATQSIEVLKDIEPSEIVVLILNSAGGKIYHLNQSEANQTGTGSIETAYGSPISFNESSDSLYFSSGVLITDFPLSFQIQSNIRSTFTNSNLVALEAILHKNHLICLVFDSVLLEYRLFAVNKNNYNSTPVEIAIDSIDGVDNQPYMYCDGTYVYFTNSNSSLNQSVNDYSIGRFIFNEVAVTMTHNSTINLDVNFSKTTNIFINGSSSEIFSLINGEFYRWNFSGTAGQLLLILNTLNGVIFKMNSFNYYTNGNIAKKLNY
jgi:hypothetical protein